MLQELLPWLPDASKFGNVALALAMAGTLVGLVLWLAGSRFSRSLITLMMVTLGCTAGMYAPRVFHWALDGWAPALIGAIVLGLFGYLLHRFWVAVGLGLVLACWAAVAAWMLCAQGMTVVKPTMEAGQQVRWTDLLLQLWQSLPADFRRVLPFACGAATLLGLLAGLLWPRFGVVLLYSSAGVSLIVCMGLVAVQDVRPQWIGALPARTGSQVALVAAMVAFGALLQWRIAPSLPKKPVERRGRPLVIDD